MTKTKLIFIGLAVALVGFLFAGSASAQDQTLTADPSVVAEAGTYDFTLTPSGFTTAATNLAICATADPGPDGWGQATLMQHCGGFGSSQDATSGDPISVEGVEVTDAGVTFLIFELVPDGQAASVAVEVDPDAAMLAETGVETSVLVIIGAGIALAGLMVFGLSRRLRTL
ncbi:MAG: LPXTG cell wall anchor domain-containing protein [Acidimicrobiia bacterium]|nr:LPXTG cell wall anchor domain-containing protein [Acidimicrobiia bacterium]MYG73549.1 LPXTG cell wall anchor domain-containing protein [Acidimicrobiia bacterium]